MRYIQINNPSDLQVLNPKTQWHLVHEELYTVKEFNRLNFPPIVNYFDHRDGTHKSIEIKTLLREIEVVKNNTYFFFGCRFTNN